MRNTESIHDLFASLLLMIENNRHDCCNAFFKRRIGRAHQLFIVLDEIDARFDQFAYEFCCLMWTQTECWLDDGADDRTLFNAGETAASGDTELWAGMRAFEGFR
ncbi:hypothetical protein FQZ97_944030 [compost metagenome]